VHPPCRQGRRHQLRSVGSCKSRIDKFTATTSCRPSKCTPAPVAKPISTSAKVPAPAGLLGERDELIRRQRAAVGCRQRTSASTAVIQPVRRSAFG